MQKVGTPLGWDRRGSRVRKSGKRCGVFRRLSNLKVKQTRQGVLQLPVKVLRVLNVREIDAIRKARQSPAD